MADPYNTAVKAADAQLFGSVTPAALPPQFVGRYAGAPIPQPAPAYVPPPVAPGFVPRFDTNSPAVKASAAAANQPAPGIVQPANAASTPAQPTSPINPLQISPLGPGITPARANAFVAGLGNYVPQAQRSVGQSPTVGADGQWNVPPLPESMLAGETGTGAPMPAGNPGDGTWAAAAMSRQGGGLAGYAGGAPAAAGRGLLDPEARINAGFDRQTATANEFMGKALDYIQQGGNIFERATRGRAIAGILHAVMGPNNAGQVQGQGIDALNNANAGITQSENYANANMHGSDNVLIGHIMSDQTENRKLDTDSIPVGTEIKNDPVTHMGIPAPTYGQRPARAGAMPTPYDTSAPKPKPQEGATGKTPDGRKVVFKNGQWAAAE